MRVVRILVIGIGLVAIFAISLWSARPAMPQSFGCVHQTIADVGSHRADPFEKLTCGTTTTVVTTSTTTSTSTSSTTTTSTSSTTSTSTSTSSTTTTSTSTSSTTTTSTTLPTDTFERAALNTSGPCSGGTCWNLDVNSCRIQNSHDLEQTNLSQVTSCSWAAASHSVGVYPTEVHGIIASCQTNDFAGPKFIDAAAHDELGCLTDCTTVKMVKVDNNTVSETESVTQTFTVGDRISCIWTGNTAFTVYRRVQNDGADVIVGTTQSVSNISTSSNWGAGFFPTTTVP